MFLLSFCSMGSKIWKILPHHLMQSRIWQMQLLESHCWTARMGLCLCCLCIPLLGYRYQDPKVCGTRHPLNSNSSLCIYLSKGCPIYPQSIENKKRFGAEACHALAWFGTQHRHNSSQRFDAVCAISEGLSVVCITRISTSRAPPPPSFFKQVDTILWGKTSPLTSPHILFSFAPHNPIPWFSATLRTKHCNHGANL